MVGGVRIVETADALSGDVRGGRGRRVCVGVSASSLWIATASVWHSEQTKSGEHTFSMSSSRRQACSSGMRG